MKSVFILIIKVLLSLLSIALLFIDIFVPSVNIGYITIILLIVAILPWIGNLKSLEIFQFGKIEFFSKEQEKKIKANSEALEQPHEPTKKYNFLYADNIPLTLAQLRIELEKRLNLLCQQNSIDEFKYRGVGRMTEVLYKQEILNGQEYSLIRDLLPAMNNAVHGKLDNEYSDRYMWVLKVAETLLNSIDQKIDNVDGDRK